jgi:hypothetical protein
MFLLGCLETARGEACGDVNIRGGKECKRKRKSGLLAEEVVVHHPRGATPHKWDVSYVERDIDRSRYPKLTHGRPPHQAAATIHTPAICTTFFRNNSHDCKQCVDRGMLWYKKKTASSRRLGCVNSSCSPLFDPLEKGPPPANAVPSGSAPRSSVASRRFTSPRAASPRAPPPRPAYWFSGRRERTALPARQISRPRISSISFSNFWR